MGTDGELARYPKILEYFQQLSKTTDRMKYPGGGQNDDGESVRAGDNQRAGEPREARPARRDQPPARESTRPERRGSEASWRTRDGAFFFLYATIHSTEVGNTQALNEIVHRLVTENSPVHQTDPRQRRPARRAVAESGRAGIWSSIIGTRRRARRFTRVYPDLYHKYRGARRQSRLVHVHAGRNADGDREGPEIATSR